MSRALRIARAAAERVLLNVVERFGRLLNQLFLGEGLEEEASRLL